MFLEKFNDISKLLVFESSNGTVNQIDNNGEKCNGIGDVRNGNTYVIFVEKSHLYLQINMTRLNLSENEVFIKYYHHENQTFVRINITHEAILEIDYPAWWTEEDLGPAAFGMDDDDDHDILAYLKMMLSTQKSKAGLINKYS